VFAGLNSQALSLISSLRAKAPYSTQNFVRGLQRGNAPRDAFKQLDANGDGVVTLKEISSFKDDKTGVLNEFLPLIKERLQLGIAGEDVSAIPGVSLGTLQRSQRFSEAEVRRLIPQ
jgi:hypothetical protein